MAIKNENYMELIDEQDSVVSAIELCEAKTPREGDWITLPGGGAYEVTRVVYCYGRRMGLMRDLALLKITVLVKRVFP